MAAMIQSLAESIAQSQFDLDHQNALLSRRFSGAEDPDSGEPGLMLDVDGRPFSLMELGFAPTCYSIASTVLDVKLSISLSSESSQPASPTKFGVSGGVGLFRSGIRANVSFMGAVTSAKYQYKSEASSYVRTRLVSVPPPGVLQERLEKMRNRKP